MICVVNKHQDEKQKDLSDLGKPGERGVRKGQGKKCPTDEGEQRETEFGWKLQRVARNQQREQR